MHDIRERENYRHYTLFEPNSSLISRASYTSQIFIGNPCFLEMFISLYVISCAQVLKES